MRTMARTGTPTGPAAAASASVATTADAAAAEKAQAFAHRLVEFADREACLKFFAERHVNLDCANEMGWSVLMSVCACGRDDLVAHVADHTTNFHCATKTNRTTVLHIAAMSKNPRIVQELTATAERRQKLHAIVDQPNINGDTPLMMACVAKNVVAAQVLLDDLHANVAQANANSMTSLMCAARASDDPRPGAPTPEELLTRSAEIVKMLLAHKADVNVVETAGGNTALHLAVLSKNVNAVQCLVEAEVHLELNCRNKAGSTAQDLSNRSSGVTAATIEELLKAKLTQQEQDAARVSAQVEQELTALAIQEAQDVEHKPTGRPRHSKKSKKNKKKAKSNTIDTSIDTNASAEDTVEQNSEVVSGTSTRVEAQEEEPQMSAKTVAAMVNVLEGDKWESVLPKRSRRKTSIGDKTSASSKPTTKGTRHRNPTGKLGAKPSPPPAPKPTPSVPIVNARPSMPVSKPLPPTASWATQAKPKAQQDTAKSTTVAPQSLKNTGETKEETTTPCMSYEQLNSSFHRAFPVATELEIGVEQFLIASAASESELEPADSLSISQVEALQEAHWQAYHYLNEKKIELTRVLEAQRVEARFTLQQELLQMD